MNRHPRQLASHRRRRGSMVPALAMALFVVGSALALVFDRLWQDAAAIELRTAAEAAVLAAAGRIASDDTLKDDADWKSILQSARDAAAGIARQNRVGGEPVELDTDVHGDVRFGRLVDNAIGERVFVETALQPNVAYVRAQQGRGSSNPAGLLVRDLTGAGRGLQIIAGATAENRIIGLRPYAGVNVPALPIALHAGSSTAGITGWNGLIEGRTGPDEWRVSDNRATLEAGPDQIHEMSALSSPHQADEKEQLLATVHVVDIGNDLNEQKLVEQCRHGWTQDDLGKWNGELRCDGGPLNLTSTPKFPAAVRRELATLVGETRLCWLFNSALPAGDAECRVTCGRLVAIRVLDVQELPDGALAMTLQPAVVVTRTALVSPFGDDVYINPYIYKVFLSE